MILAANREDAPGSLRVFLRALAQRGDVNNDRPRLDERLVRRK
jgi:hypothetical protein